jgi:hypothetical protein
VHLSSDAIVLSIGFFSECSELGVSLIQVLSLLAQLPLLRCARTEGARISRKQMTEAPTHAASITH